MGVMVQIRNMPEAVHRRLKARAAEAGMSLSDYLLAEVTRAAEIPTWEEMRARLAALPRIETDFDVADFIREGREEREAQTEAALRDRR